MTPLPSYPTTRSARTVLRQTAAYYERVSRGQESFQVTLTRWVHVRASAETMCSRQGASARIARRALARAGYHPQRYNRLMLLTEQCNAAVSVGQQSGQLSWIRFRDPGMATLVHELGHNLGLQHAYGVVCREGDLRVPLGGRCRRVQYGDSWDAMGHSNASFSVPVLARLGWAGRVATASTSGSFRLADVEHSGRHLQGVRIPVGGGVTYWVEYQPEHSPQIGRSIPGVTIRRQVGHGPVEILDASPGNPSAFGFPDRDLSNPALPVGGSITTPEGVRLTTVPGGGDVRSVARRRSPAEPPTRLSGALPRRLAAPDDHGQIVLGYRVTAHRAEPSCSCAAPLATAPRPCRVSPAPATSPSSGHQAAVSAAAVPVRPVERQGRSRRFAT